MVICVNMNNFLMCRILFIVDKNNNKIIKKNCGSKVESLIEKV